MSRGVGEFDPIQEQFPEWGAVLVALLTQLGDVWFLTLVLVTVYWTATSRRDEIAALIGVALGGIGLYRGFKYLFEFPRPDEPLMPVEYLPWVVQPLYEATAFAGGYGFPSGHATNTTIVYVGLAGILTVGTRRLRYTVAATLVTVVCVTRIALGVHYLVDVVAGVALGIALLLVTDRLFSRYPVDRPTIAFGLAIGLSGWYLLTSNLDEEAILLAGAALGAFGGWQLIELGRRLVESSSVSEAVVPVAVRLGLAIAAFAPIGAALEYFPLLTAYVAASGVGMATAVVITLPIARQSRHVDRVLSEVVFLANMSFIALVALSKPETWRAGYVAGRRYLDRLRNTVSGRERD